MTQRPPVDLQYEDVLDDDSLYVMLEQLGSVASVYFKPAEEFIKPQRGPLPVSTHTPIPENLEEEAINDSESDDIDIFADEAISDSSDTEEPPEPDRQESGHFVDLDGESGDDPAELPEEVSPQPKKKSDLYFDDLFT